MTPCPMKPKSDHAWSSEIRSRILGRPAAPTISGSSAPTAGAGHAQNRAAVTQGRRLAVRRAAADASLLIDLTA